MFSRGSKASISGMLTLLSLALVARSSAQPSPSPIPSPTSAPTPTPSKAAPAKPPAARTPYDQELAERKARFAQESSQSGSAAAVVPLLGLSELWDLVDDRAALVAFITDAARP